MDAAFAYDVAMRRADSLAEVELRQMARRQVALSPTAAQLEVIEKLAAMSPGELAGLDAALRSDIEDIAAMSRMMLKNASAEAIAKDTIATEDDFLDMFEKLRYAYIKAVKGATSR